MYRTTMAALLVIVAVAALAGPDAAERTRRSRRKRATEAAEQQADTSTEAKAQPADSGAADTAAQAAAGPQAQTDSAAATADTAATAAAATDKKPAVAPPAQPAPAAAVSEPSEIIAARAEMCTSVVAREPQGSGDQFASGVGRVCCFTHIKGVQDTSEVRHMWYRGDSLVSMVVLPVRSPSWRTYSAKAVSPGESGDWKVVVSQGDGETVLATLQFKVLP